MSKNARPIKEVVQAAHKEFTQEVDGLTVDQLRDRIVSMQKQLKDSEAAKDADDELRAMKEAASLAGAPYRDVRKAVALKTKYIIELLKEKGDSK